MKKILLLGFIAIFGIFIYVKIQVLGDPNSSFNKTTRYTIGKHPILRSLFSLHSAGDARAEFLLGQGPINIEWFKDAKESDDTVNDKLLDRFAKEVTKYTGRNTQVFYGGDINSVTVPLTNLAAYELKSTIQKPSGTTLLVFFTQDYSPRPDNEISITYGDSGIAISLNAHRQFLNGYSSGLESYLMSSMLHEFGHQLGLEHNTQPYCIMNPEVEKPTPQSIFNLSYTPTQYCDYELRQLSDIKAKSY